jgi:hypothetical protein
MDNGIDSPLHPTFFVISKTGFGGGALTARLWENLEVPQLFVTSTLMVAYPEELPQAIEHEFPTCVTDPIFEGVTLQKYV